MARLMQPVMQRYPETPGPTEPPDAPEIVLQPDVELASHSRLPRLDLGVDWGSPWHDFRTSVWGFDLSSSNSLTVYIGYLRAKIEAAGEPRFLHTVRGVGYVLREAVKGPSLSEPLLRRLRRNGERAARARNRVR